MTNQPSNESEVKPDATGATHATHASEVKSTPDPHTTVTARVDPNDPDTVIIRTRKRKRKKKQKQKRKMHPALRVFLIVLAVVVGLLAAVGIALAIAVNMGNVNLHKVFNGLENTPENVAVEDSGQTIEYNGHKYRYNENVISFLVIGRDDESNYANVTRKDATCADLDILFTMDTATNKMHAIIIPRNSWVPVDLYDADHNFVGTKEMQLALSHAVMLPTIEECAANTTKSVSYLFYNLPITYYVDMDFEVVKQASTAIGGVPVEVLDPIPGTSFVPGETVLLTGDNALKYVRYRDVDEFESALDRQERQIQFVKSFANKLSSLSPQDIVVLYNSVSGNVVTNLGVSEIAYLAYCFTSGNNSDLAMTKLEGWTDVVAESDGIELERYYLDKNNVVENMLEAFYTRVD